MDDNIITTSELLRQSSPELPRSPAPLERAVAEGVGERLNSVDESRRSSGSTAAFAREGF